MDKICPDCDGKGVIPVCTNCSHHRFTGFGGGQSICNKGLKMDSGIITVGSAEKLNCSQWKKTKSFISDHNKCKTCKGTGRVSVYETPEQYKQRTGKDLPESAPVYPRAEFGWGDCRTYYVAKIQNWKTMILGNELGKPPSDYRLED